MEEENKMHNNKLCKNKIFELFMVKYYMVVFVTRTCIHNRYLGSRILIKYFAKRLPGVQITSNMVSLRSSQNLGGSGNSKIRREKKADIER